MPPAALMRFSYCLHSLIRSSTVPSKMFTCEGGMSTNNSSGTSHGYPNRKRLTVREEFTEHEGVVRFWVIFRETNVFVHVEGDYVLEPGFHRQQMHRSLVNATHVSFSSLTSLIRALYVGIGDEPVGSPSTKGFSAVGAKSLMLQIEMST